MLRYCPVPRLQSSLPQKPPMLPSLQKSSCCRQVKDSSNMPELCRLSRACLIWVVALAQHGDCIGQEASQSCARLLVTALLHHEPSVRRVAQKSASHCVDTSVSLADGFIKALQDLLASPSSYQVTPRKCCTGNCLHFDVLIQLHIMMA